MRDTIAGEERGALHQALSSSNLTLAAILKRKIATLGRFPPDYGRVPLRSAQYNKYPPDWYRPHKYDETTTQKGAYYPYGLEESNTAPASNASMSWHPESVIARSADDR